MDRLNIDIDDENVEELVKKVTEEHLPGGGSAVYDVDGNFLRYESKSAEQLDNELDFVDDWRASGVGFMPVKFTKDSDKA